MKSRYGFLALPGLLPLLALGNPVTCEFAELSRRIEVVYSNPGQAVPCEVIYDKSGEGTIETLWRANFQTGYCEEKANGLVEKLSDMGWQCDKAAEADDPSRLQ